MTRLRTHRREAKALAGAVAANRKRVSDPRREDANKTSALSGSRHPFRFRVELWKDSPEVRVGHGDFVVDEDTQLRDLGFEIASRIMEWASARIPAKPDPVWDAPAGAYVASDEDIPF